MAVLSRRLAVARGDEPADLVITGGKVLSVFTREWLEADVAIVDGFVAGLGDYEGRDTLDAAGRWVVPGLIDAHMHIETVKLLPDELSRLLLPLGTTTVVADPHEIANVLGTDGVHWLLDVVAGLPLEVYFMASSCVPASPLESPRRPFTTGDIEGLLHRSRVLGLAEMMNFPGVISGSEPELAKLALAEHVDGHAPGVLGRRLNAYAAAGIRSDHEASTVDEGRERLRAGMWLLIREASAARNLETLIPLAREYGSSRIAFCTDDREPEHVAEDGHVNAMVRDAVALGIPPEDALVMATLSPALYHGLQRLGAVAPGYRADVLVLPDLVSFVPDVVLCAGAPVGEVPRVEVPAWVTQTVRLAPVAPDDFRIPWRGGRARVIGLVPHEIVTAALDDEPTTVDGHVVADPGRDLAKIAVLERHHGTGRTGLGLVRGFGLQRGALASTVAHDAHNLVVVGADDDAMALVANRLREIGGGVAVADGSGVLAELPLPVAGLLSDRPLAEVLDRSRATIAAAEALGVTVPAPFQLLAFLALSVIPALKITDLGLVDVDRAEVVPLALDAAGERVGRSVRRTEGPAKLTGRALFTSDLDVPGAWYGATVRSTEPRARLLAIEPDPAFDWSQVVLVTAADIPGENVVSLMSDDQPALAAAEIRHVAEPVALVAAPDPELARAARDHVRLRTEPLPPVLDAVASETAFKELEIVRGDLDAGFAQADVVVEGTYRAGHQEQLYLEPQAMIAIPRTDGGITVHGSLQCPYYAHVALKRALALDDEQAVVVQEETGGGFGGKEEYPSMVAIHAALLARRAGRPVRLVYDRHEDVAATTKRHPAVVTHRTGVTRDGRLVAQDVELVLDAGAYATLSPVVLSRSALHAGGPYACPNVRIRARAAATNTPPNGAFRGFGAPQSQLAAELQVERVAAALGVSPLELRRRWAYREGDVTPTGQVLRESVAALDVLERAADASGYERARSRGARSDRIASGVGLALGWHGAGFTGSGEERLASVAAVELSREGVVRVLSAQTEIGQGARTVLAQLVAEALGVPVDDVDVIRPDTSVVPDSGPTVASRTTMVVGALLVTAARRLRADVEARSGRSFAESYDNVARADGPFRESERFAGFPGVEWDDDAYRGDAYPAFGWGCAVAEVDVDLDTGEVHVRRVVAADDAGRIVNPVLAEGQVEGGTLQAVGYATIEEIKVDSGRYLNDRLATYLIPTALDAPAIEAILVEHPFSGVPHGAKGLGELPMDVGAPAVVAAIHDATGAWVTELPATPERVLAALDALRPAEASP